MESFHYLMTSIIMYIFLIRSPLCIASFPFSVLLFECLARLSLFSVPLFSVFSVFPGRVLYYITSLCNSSREISDSFIKLCF